MSGPFLSLLLLIFLSLYGKFIVVVFPYFCMCHLIFFQKARPDIMYKRVETEVNGIYALSWTSLLMDWVFGHYEWRLILVRS